jgi:hypothetical protein
MFSHAYYIFYLFIYLVICGLCDNSACSCDYIWMEAVVAYFDILFQRFPAETDINHKRYQTGHPVSGSIFEPGD